MRSTKMDRDLGSFVDLRVLRGSSRPSWIFASFVDLPVLRGSSRPSWIFVIYSGRLNIPTITAFPIT
jgi:hypothetical protein